jgi:hypothetical protein
MPIALPRADTRRSDPAHGTGSLALPCVPVSGGARGVSSCSYSATLAASPQLQLRTAPAHRFCSTASAHRILGARALRVHSASRRYIMVVLCIGGAVFRGGSRAARIGATVFVSCCSSMGSAPHQAAAARCATTAQLQRGCHGLWSGTNWLRTPLFAGFVSAGLVATVQPAPAALACALAQDSSRRSQALPRMWHAVGALGGAWPRVHTHNRVWPRAEAGRVAVSAGSSPDDTARPPVRVSRRVTDRLQAALGPRSTTGGGMT